MSNFGRNGRLGNQLFQYASLMGLSGMIRDNLALPKWDYAEFFAGKFPEMPNITRGHVVREREFEYGDYYGCTEPGVYDFQGYFQSEKYWQDYPEVKEALSFKRSFKLDCAWKFIKTIDKDGLKAFDDSIAIHIRMGDYVNNPNYYELPITYYILALFEHFPNWEKMNLVIFSDDIEWCKTHFQFLPNAYFSEGYSDIEDLCIASYCNHFILSNSTYSWWMAYLGQDEHSKVVRPAHYFGGKLLERNNTKDFWPDNWIEFEHEGKKIDLMNTKFVCYSPDPMANRHIMTLLEVYFTGYSIFICKIEAKNLPSPARIPVYYSAEMLNAVFEGVDYKPDYWIAPLQIWYMLTQWVAGALRLRILPHKAAIITYEKP